MHAWLEQLEQSISHWTCHRKTQSGPSAASCVCLPTAALLAGIQLGSNQKAPQAGASLPKSASG
jgi:hypothetical protein